ncbi:MAG: hypothetical protein Q7U20_02460, partial [Caulobacter sp.]|nr:hypothetical protein [Caulobacter sp.]
MSKTFTCLFGLVLLVSVLTIGCGDDNNPGTPLTGTITIDPEPNSINAPWQITGPGGFDQSGVGDLTLNDMATGDYTLTWGVVSDWIAPSPETVTQELTADAAVTIGGIYLVNPYPFPDTAQKLMTTFMNAYDNMNIVEYRNVLHPDFKFKFAEGSDVEPSGYYTREQDLQTTTRMFNGEQGMSEIGEVMPGVRDIDFRLLEQLS